MKQARGTTLTDVLPEQFHYRDEGCEISSSCLHCPLPQCKYDDPGWMRRERIRERNRNVVDIMNREGLSVSAAASRFHLSQRTIFRILSRTQH